MSRSASFGSAVFAVAFVSLVIAGAGQSHAAPVKILVGSSSILDRVALNPQPLPPKEGSAGVSVIDEISLNPQPLPPRDGSSRSPILRGIIVVGGRH